MKHLLDVQNLSVAFRGEDRSERTVVDSVSFHVDPGEILCIVGESGCGKSVTALAIMDLLSRNGRVTKGSIRFDGQELIGMSSKEMDRIRGSKMTMVFQDALTSLNPVFTVGRQLCESLRIHQDLDRKQAAERALTLLEKVGLPDPATIMKKFPHQLSGGQRQRVMIAIALSCDPKLLIADEPTTALDVTIQSQIMSMTRDLIHEFNMSMILITHDLGLVAEMADRVIVMYAGQIVETADVYSLFQAPAHPYTKALMGAVPSIYDPSDRQLASIRGTVPENYTELTGCRFAARCDHAREECLENSRAETTFSLRKLSHVTEKPHGISYNILSPAEHTVRCILYAPDSPDTQFQVKTDSTENAPASCADGIKEVISRG